MYDKHQSTPTANCEHSWIIQGTLWRLRRTDQESQVWNQSETRGYSTRSLRPLFQGTRMFSTTGRVSIIWYEKGNSRKIYTIRLRYPHCRIVEFVMLSSCMTVRPQMHAEISVMLCVLHTRLLVHDMSVGLGYWIRSDLLNPNWNWFWLLQTLLILQPLTLGIVGVWFSSYI